MPAFASIAPDKLVQLIGTPRVPVFIDVREDEALAADQRLIPLSTHLPYATAEQ